MSAAARAGCGAGAVIAAGAWLRWSVKAVMVGYRCGFIMGRMEQARRRRKEQSGSE